MSSPVGFAILGTGLISEFHATAIGQVPGAKLQAVFSRRPEAAQAFAAKHGCRAVATLKEIAGDPSVRAVCVTTPSGTHAEVAVPLLEAGKAVLCEKPLEITPEGVERMVSAAQRGRALLAGVFQMRLGRGAQLLKAAIDAGRFGRLTLCSAYIKWWREQSYYDSSTWKGTWKLDGGGALMNQGIHAVDLLQWLAGMPEEVCAFNGTLAHSGMEAEDTIVAALKFPHGALGVIEAATSAYPGSDVRLEIIGDRGTAVLVTDRIVRWEFAEPRLEDREVLANTATGVIGGGTSSPGAITAEGHRQLIADLVDALREGRAPMIPGSEARKAVALVLAIYRAVRNGTSVRVLQEPVEPARC
jgi:predicted dehydrogenase